MKLEKRNSQFTSKLWIVKILERWLFIAKKVPYKFPNDIPLQLSTLHVINCQKTETQKKKFSIYEKTVNHKNSQKVALCS